jgi:hypothetical protein
MLIKKIIFVVFENKFYAIKVYSKNYDFVPLTLPLPLPVTVTDRYGPLLTVTEHRYSPLLTVTHRYRYSPFFGKK